MLAGILTCGRTATAQDAAARQPIRSGCEVDYAPFCIVHEDGRADGFSVELLRAALAEMGREATFRTGLWSDVRGWLERGEVDVLPLVGRTPEREELFDFTVPYLTMHGAIVVREDTTDVHTLVDLRGRRVGVMSADNAEEFLRRTDRGFEIVTTPTFTDAFRALAEGRCDAVVIQRLLAIRLIEEAGLDSLKIVDRPIHGFAQHFCFAVEEGDRETLALLNEGLALVIADGTHRHLHAKWFASLELPSDRPIVIGGDHNYPPFEYLDEKGRPTGFTVELTRAIARAMNMDVRVRLGPWADTVDALREGRIDAIQGMFYSAERDRVLDFSPRYLVIHCVSVVRKDGGPPPTTFKELEGRDLVVQAGDAILDEIATRGIDARIATVATQDDVVRAVAEGRHGCGLVTRYGALHAIREHGWTHLDLSDQAFYSGQYGYAVPHGNEALLAEFTEGLRMLKDSGEYQRLHEKWMGVYEEHLLWGDVLKVVALVAGPLLLIAVLALLWSWLLRRQVAARTRELRESLARLARSETLLNAAQRIGRIGGWEWDVAQRQVFWTDETYRIHDLDPAGLEAGSPEHIDRSTACYAEADREQVTAAFHACVESGIPYNLECRFTTVGGRNLWIRTSGQPVLEDGRVVKVIGDIQDITDRKQQEARIGHLNRVLRALRDVNQLITHETDRDELLRRSCEILISTRGYRSAWVALRDANGTLHAVNEAGIGEDFGALREAIKRGDWPECCRCVMEEPDGIATMHDTDRNCKSCLLSHTYRDTAALAGALRYGGREYGVLVVALPAGMADDTEEQSLFRELVGDVAYALYALENAHRRQQEEAKFRSYVENAPYGIFIADRTGRYLDVNPAACGVTGYSRDELLSMNISDLLPGDGIEEGRRHFQTLVEHGRSDGEMDFVRKNGEARRWHVLAVALGTDRFLGFVEDVTIRKQFEKELARSRTELQAIYDSSPVMFCVVDEQRRVLDANRAFTSFVGEGDEAVRGGVACGVLGCVNALESPGGCGHGADCPDCALLQALQDTLQTGVGHTGIERRLTLERDGRRQDVTLLAATAALQGEQGAKALLCLTDITDRRVLEAQLAQAQKMESVGRLAGGVAHDFNNLLMGIMNYTELIRDRIEPDHPIREWLAEITHDAERSATLIRQLLAFARKQTVALRVLDLNDAVANMLKMLRRLIGEDIDLVWRPGATLWPVRIDPGQLDQVLANLCVNARDAIGGPGKVTIETENVSIDANYCKEHVYFKPGDYVMMAVSDDGCGMDRETLENVFEPFFTTKGVGEGTGLGLATVYGIVKQNEGVVNAYSDLGEGTTFRVYLPRFEGTKAEATEGSPATERPCGTETILLVEDEKSIRVTLRLFLEDLGYTVLPADGPEAAMRLVAEHAGEIDLLVTDVVMPGMSGRALAEKLAAGHPSMKVLYMSGYTVNVIAHRGILEEGVHFMSKPVSRDALARKVREVMG